MQLAVVEPILTQVASRKAPVFLMFLQNQVFTLILVPCILFLFLACGERSLSGEIKAVVKERRGRLKKCLIIASELLTEDYLRWIEVAEYTLLVA
jgi:hypothetical protein